MKYFHIFLKADNDKTLGETEMTMAIVRETKLPTSCGSRSSPGLCWWWRAPSRRTGSTASRRTRAARRRGSTWPSGSCTLWTKSEGRQSHVARISGSFLNLSLISPSGRDAITMHFLDRDSYFVSCMYSNFIWTVYVLFEYLNLIQLESLYFVLFCSIYS